MQAHGRLGLHGLARLSGDGTTGVWTRGEGSAQVRQGVRLAPKCSVPRRVPMPMVAASVAGVAGVAVVAGVAGVAEIAGGAAAGTAAAAAPLRVRSVACGTDHTVVVCANGAVYCFGRGQAGQLGTGDRKDRLEPVAVAGFAPRGAAATAVVTVAAAAATAAAAAPSEEVSGGGDESGDKGPTRESAEAPASPLSCESVPSDATTLTAAQLAQRTNTTTSVLSRWG